MTNSKPKVIPTYGQFNFYAGDPCYVIDDDRWMEFCDKLPSDMYKHDAGTVIKWEVKDEDGDIETFDIAVFNSPGGDGVWAFRDSVKNMAGWVAGHEMGVDAGLLAVVPVECMSEEVLSNWYGTEYRTKWNPCGDGLGGILFTFEPEIEISTGWYSDKVEVQLNGYPFDGCTGCDFCGGWVRGGHGDYCDNCGYISCGCDCCDCRECSKCGEWMDSYNDSCSCCEDCGETEYDCTCNQYECDACGEFWEDHEDAIECCAEDDEDDY